MCTTKNWILITVLILITTITTASDCYNYHTLHHYTIYEKNDNIIFKHREKDPDGISYVTEDLIVLKNINSQGFKLLSENDEHFLFSTIDGYFMLRKETYLIKEYGAFFVGSHTDIQDSAGVHFICRNNQWTYILVDYYNHGDNEYTIATMPKNLEIISTYPARKIICKNQEDVFYFDTETHDFHKIKDLNGKSTLIFQTKEHNRLGPLFLYDEDTFYTIGVHDINNVTTEFTSQHQPFDYTLLDICLLYTSDAADD